VFLTFLDSAIWWRGIARELRRACGNRGEAGDRPRPVALETPPVRRHGDDCCPRVDGLAVAEGAHGRSRAAFSEG